MPTPESEQEEISFRAIGHVENAFEDPAAPDLIRATTSRVVLEPALEGGLEGIEPGQELIIVFHFHRSSDFALQQHPRGDRSRPRRGVFALRSPNRPNPIGVTLVRLISIEGHVLQVQGLDAINGTPVLDIKPA